MLKERGHEAVVFGARRAKVGICTKKKTENLDGRDLARMARTG